MVRQARECNKSATSLEPDQGLGVGSGGRMQRRLLGSSTPRHGCDAAAPSTTAVAVGSRDTVPHAQTWADLRWASYEAGSFLLHDPSGALFRGGAHASDEPISARCGSRGSMAARGRPAAQARTSVKY